TLWLRKNDPGGPLKLDDDWERCRRELRQHFRYEQLNESFDGFAPGVVAAEHVIWPKYPVSVQNWKNRIDDRFHLDHLCPLSTNQWSDDAENEGVSPARLGHLAWAVYDWVDCDGPDATGSRIRLWFPQQSPPPSLNDLPADPSTGSPLLPFWQLASLVE